jgi:hypothetical protein
MTRNLAVDTSKTKPLGLLDFALFHKKDEAEAAVFSAEVAAIALALRHEDKTPPLLLSVWPHVLASATDTTTLPTCRAFHNDDNSVFIVHPQWEGKNCRGGLVLVRGQICGPVRVRDLDKPLLTYDLVLPERHAMGWIEAGLLLQRAET